MRKWWIPGHFSSFHLALVDFPVTATLSQELIKCVHVRTFLCVILLAGFVVFLTEQFKGKIPVPPIQELFELEPNVLSKRWGKDDNIH